MNQQATTGYLKPSGSPIRQTLSAKLMTAIVSWLLSFLFLVAMTGILTWHLEDRSKAILRAANVNVQLAQLAQLTQNPNPQTLAQHKTATQQAWQEWVQSMQYLHDNSADWQTLQNDVAALWQQWDRLPETQRDADIAHLQQRLQQQTAQLEAQNTQRISQLRLVRLGLAIWIIGSAWACFVMLRRWVLRPLADIHNAIERVTSGNLNTQLHIQSQDEFQAVGEGFNRMTLNLQDMYANLENKVAQKTAELQRRHDEWETLYRISAALQYQPFGTMMQGEFLRHVLALWDLAQGAVVWQNGRHHQIGAAQNLSSDALALLLRYLDNTVSSGSLFAENNSIYLPFDGHLYHLTAVYAHQQFKGILLLSVPTGCLKPEDTPLLALLASHLGAACENDEAAQIRWRNAVLEERNLIAQGLHDSLAQSLSFLNMRFQMLRKDEKWTQNAAIRDNLNLIQEGIDCCHADVRELLNGFRTRFHCGDFVGSVQQLAARLNEETGIKTDVYVLSDEVRVSRTQEIQLLFILQEALSNIRKHSRASHVEITLDGENDFVMEISDNGIGFSINTLPESGHIGLKVMQERASRIDADCVIHADLGCGTSINVLIAADKR